MLPGNTQGHLALANIKCTMILVLHLLESRRIELPILIQVLYSFADLAVAPFFELVLVGYE